MIRVGIECEQLEQARFGIGHTLAQFLEQITKVPGIEKKFRFVLYFKAKMPDDAFLNHPVFKKKVLMQGRGWFKVSFNIFYHILLPLRYWIDRIDVFLFPSNMLPAFFVGKAIVVLVNDVYWEAHHGTIPFRYRISYLLFCWWAAKRATIMTISEFSRKELQKAYHIPDRRIFVNPWGIDAMFRPMHDAKKDLFLSVGQAFPRRHVKETIEAFGLIANENSQMRYLVACTDKYNPPVLKETVERINKKLGREAIMYTDYLARDEMPRKMNETKAVIYVSSKEALGLPPIEAVACGTPVIAADTETTREIFGDNGFFVEHPEDPGEIAAEMRKVLADPKRAADITKIQSQKVARFSWQAHTKKLLDTIHDLVS